MNAKKILIIINHFLQQIDLTLNKIDVTISLINNSTLGVVLIM